MKRALDLYIEKQACDRSADLATSRAMSREVNDICRNGGLPRHQTLAARDKTALASAAMMTCSPLVLFGVGATFAFIDDVDYRNNLKEIESGRQQDRQMRKGVCVDKDREKISGRQTRLAAQALLSLDLSAANKRRRPEKRRADQAVFSPGREQLTYRYTSKSWLEVNKLVKRKQFLLDEIERVNKGQQLSLVSHLMSQLERLDKALKRMGC